MDQIFKELGLYDLLAYFVTGAVALGSVMASVAAFSRTRSQQNEISFWQSETKLAVTFFVIGSYITGHMIQATGSILDRDLFNRPLRNTIEQRYAGEKNEKFRDQLQTMVDEAFHNPPSEQVFNLCQTYTQIRGIDAYVQTMQGRYAFFRGLTIAFCIAGLSFPFKGYWDYKRTPRNPSNYKRSKLQGFFLVAVLPLLFFLGALIALSRQNDFSNYFADHVYRTFYVSYSLSRAQPAHDR